jgi:hypothetical protein
MTDGSKYVVVCDCTGENKIIAYIDDRRSDDGLVKVQPAAPAWGAINILNPEGPLPIEQQLALAESDLSERNVTETFWPSGKTSWAIRCTSAACVKQAEISQERLWALADLLGATLVELDNGNPPVLVPDPGEPQVSIDLDGTATRAERHKRHVIPLSLLCLIVTRFNV